MRIAVTGSSGLIGTALARLLQDQGHEVVPIVRRHSEGAAVFWDLQAGRIEGRKLEGVDAVVHLAGENIARRWTAQQKTRIRDSRILGTTLLSRALAELSRPPATLISASAIGYYGDRGDGICTEDTASGQTFLAEVCRVWEQSADPAREAGIRVVHPRIGVVLSRDGGALPKMLLPFRLGVGGRIGSGRQYLSWISLDDLVHAILFAIQEPSLEGPINATAPQPVTNQQFTHVLGRVLQRPTWFPVPRLVLRTMLGQMADDLLLASTRVLPNRLQAAGYTFLHSDLETALRSVLQS